MEKRLKQSVGIDCAKDDFVASFGITSEEYDIKILSTETFKNNEAGFKKLQKWAKEKLDKDISVAFVMEATGVYHERLACFLFDDQQKVSVVLPQRAKNFTKTLKGKTVTDKESSKALAIMGLEKKLELWQKPEEIYNILKQLTREREQLQNQLTEVKNQVHAENAGAWPNEKSLIRMRRHEVLLNEQMAEIIKDVTAIIKSNPALAQKIDFITSIPGIGLLTAAIVIAETDGFNQIRNKKQLVSYAGYDVVQKESGTSVRGKTHISHKGNRHIRKAMHMPALSSIKYNHYHKEQFIRLVGKHGIKMKAVVAIQRKQLVMIYTLWKKNEYFNKSKIEPSKKLEQPKEAALNELVLDRS